MRRDPPKGVPFACGVFLGVAVGVEPYSAASYGKIKRADSMIARVHKGPLSDHCTTTPVDDDSLRTRHSRIPRAAKRLALSTRLIAAGLVSGAAILSGSCPSAAEEIVWKQVQAIARGEGLPQGVRGDIRGIELGATYTEAKARIEALRSEANVPAADAKLKETQTVFQLPTPHGSITAAYVGKVQLEIRTSQPRGDDYITVRFSAPSSGHQVYSIERLLIYSDQKDQPRISEVAASLKKKFQAEPLVIKGPESVTYRFQFDGGKAWLTNPQPFTDCSAVTADTIEQSRIAAINDKGICDVVFEMEATYGISDDHIESVWFRLTDNDRMKANLTADFGFFQTYIDKSRARTAGSAPKL